MEIFNLSILIEGLLFCFWKINSRFARIIIVYRGKHVSRLVSRLILGKEFEVDEGNTKQQQRVMNHTLA